MKVIINIVTALCLGIFFLLEFPSLAQIQTVQLDEVTIEGLPFEKFAKGQFSFLKIVQTIMNESQFIVELIFGRSPNLLKE